jgi:anion-transporting  ArsA/GET3 family ATPase
VDAPVDGLLGSAEVVLVVGAGGVGKTTIAAALAARAAGSLGRRALVVTVDPARRLADALGVADVPAEPVLVPVEGEGRLWASMVDMAQSWDEMVVRHAPRSEVADDLLANPLYRTLTREFIQSHDYIALDRLCDLAQDDRYDLVVIDTPPSSHAIDVLDAPDRMLDFFDGRLLRWLTAPYRSRLAILAAKPFLAVAERMLGGPFLARIGEFFWLFSQLQPGFAARAKEVRRRLHDPDTHYLLVTTAESSALDQAGRLLEELARRHHLPSLVVHNRSVPVEPGTTTGAVERVQDERLRAAMTALLRSDVGPADLVTTIDGPVPGLVTVPWRAGDLSSVGALADLVTPDRSPGRR